jgi:dolichyl-phosphate beta-glucosyltransferase
MMGEPYDVIVVVPCYNEAARLDTAAFLSLAKTDGLSLVFVDDGSTDSTGRILASLADESDAIRVATLRSNQGKAEAVRQGLQRALTEHPRFVSYYDADLATPPEELLRLIDTAAENPGLSAVLGARVARLGSRVERSVVRHYLGRIFATAASLALGVTVYDTQCGAKVFRVSPVVEKAVAKPFRSRWAFDVEFLQRLLAGSSELDGLQEHELLELPLNSWRHVTGSKLRMSHAVGAALELLRIAGIRRTRHGQSRAR